MAKTVWLNLDENKVDVTCLDQKFAEAGIHFIKRPIDRSDEETTIEMGLKADAVISTWEPWNERTLNAVKDKVQFIVRYGAGTDNIDIPAATRAGIPVANTPGANAAAVAETAMLHILNAGRRFTQCVGGVKKSRLAFHHHRQRTGWEDGRPDWVWEYRKKAGAHAVRL